MRKLVVLLLAISASGCAGSSYGASTDGTFPGRAGGDYPNWEHMCIVFDSGSATRILQESGEKGWELVGIGKQGSEDMMCFKRAKGMT